MLNKLFRLFLIVVILHLHAPLCRYIRVCGADLATDCQGIEQADVCECCRTKPAQPASNQGYPCDKPASPSDHCLCVISATGYITLTATISIELLEVLSDPICLNSYSATQDGYREGIHRPPR
jgi:hypothetical protein